MDFGAVAARAPGKAMLAAVANINAKCAVFIEGVSIFPRRLPISIAGD